MSGSGPAGPGANPGDSPLAVTQYIGDMLRYKRTLLDELYEADVKARNLRREATRIESRTWLTIPGSNELKKHKARADDAVQAAMFEADAAEAAMWNLRALITHCGDAIEGARTAAATLRAEFSVLGMSGEGS